MTPTVDFDRMTSQIKLSKELVSLVHFVELNESGWVKKTLARIILSILREKAGSLTQIEISSYLSLNAAHDFSADEISAAVNFLISDGKVVERTKGAYQIRQAAMLEIDSAIATTMHEEEVTKARFIESFEKNVPGVDPESLWPYFLDSYLYPLIQDAGASALDLISGSGNSIASKENLHPFLQYIDEERRDEAAHAVIVFLDPGIAEVRQFILKRLATSFFVAAVSLDKATVDQLDKRRKKETYLKLFLDTNALFSALSLHEHEGNADVEGLLALNRSPHAKVKLKIFVLPETLSEATTVLANAASSLGSTYYPSGLAAAGLRANVSGVRAKYLQAAAKSSSALTAKEYFDPYINDLPAVLRSRGIEIIDRSLLVSKTDQEVIDDTLGLVEWEKKHVSAERRKGYEAVLHDVYAWHCVRFVRPEGISSPIEAQEWFITLDRRLLSFDLFKRKGLSRQVPICIRPSTFLAYSQFWTPRTVEFERALFGSLKLPLLFREFDAETEDVTLAILRKLSRFESVGDFSTDELQSILLNSAVRTKFADSRDETAQQELIRDQLLQVHAVAAEKAKALEAELLSQQAEAGAVRGEMQRSSQAADATISDLKSQNLEMVEKEARNKKTIEELAALNDEQNRKLTLIEEEKMRIRQVRKFCLIVFLLPILCATICAFVLTIFFTIQYVVGCAVLLMLSLSFFFNSHLGPSNVSVQKTLWLKRTSSIMKAFWVPTVAFLILTASAVYQNILQDKQPEIIKEVSRSYEEAKANSNKK